MNNYKKFFTLYLPKRLDIKDEKLGIRLENDFLITKNGPVDLMEHIPIEAEEIEGLMNEKS